MLGSNMTDYERRVSKRYEVELDSRIQVEEGTVYGAQVVNISSSGLQLQVSNQIIPYLMPNKERKFVLDTVSLDIDMTLPGIENSTSIKLGIVYMRRISMHESVIGCRFEAFNQSSARDLEHYIDRLENRVPSVVNEPAELLYLV